MQTPSISLCMIVKNEANFIEACLQSVKDFVDEMIVVDTGSTDQTVQICENLNAAVYHYQWNHHFADARNFGLSKAKGDWILWLDADETFDSSQQQLVKDTLSRTEASMIFLPVISYYGDDLPIQTDQAYIYYQPRLFKNHAGIQFYNRIHETPLFPKGASNDQKEYLDVPVHHYGYIKEVTNREEKSKRNFQLLEEERKVPNHSPWIEYHLASEYYRTLDYQTAFDLLNEAIFQFLLQGFKPPAMIYRLKYTILVETQSFEGAWPGIEKAIELYPDYVDLHYIKGIILFNMKKYDDALAAFEKCLELGEDHKEYLITKGFGSFYALHMKNVCLEQLKMKG
jgi:glycosyltransferase involved in cell wall biosynthesis